MSKYHCIVDGEVKDIIWKKFDNQRGYHLYLDDTFIGQIFKMNGGEWSAVAWGKIPASTLRRVVGFNSRWRATEYILRAKRYWVDD